MSFSYGLSTLREKNTLEHLRQIELRFICSPTQSSFVNGYSSECNRYFYFHSITFVSRW